VAEPGRWVLKGGMALEVRLADRARVTKDVDLGLRDDVLGGEQLRTRLASSLREKQADDMFALKVGPAKRLAEDLGGEPTWRMRIVADLAERIFGSVQVDISPRARELGATDLVALPNSLDFAGIASQQIEIIDIHRHAAEKLHAMLKDFGDRDNTRVRDLVDLVMLTEHELLDAPALAVAVEGVWAERDGVMPPVALPALPASWSDRYERLAVEHTLAVGSFGAALDVATTLWTDMFPADRVEHDGA